MFGRILWLEKDDGVFPGDIIEIDMRHSSLPDTGSVDNLILDES
jgi:hypothetical protein